MGRVNFKTFYKVYKRKSYLNCEGQFLNLLQHLTVGFPEAPGLHEQTGVLPTTLHRAPTPQTPGSSHNDKFSSFSYLKKFSFFRFTKWYENFSDLCFTCALEAISFITFITSAQWHSQNRCSASCVFITRRKLFYDHFWQRSVTGIRSIASLAN